MKKSVSELLKSFEYTVVDYDGSSQLSPSSAEKAAHSAFVTSLEFDSRKVKRESMFFALPGTHTTGNHFIADAVNAGATAVVFEGDFTSEEKNEIANAVSKAEQNTIFIKVKSARYAMSPISKTFYDDPSSHLVIYGVTGTEGKSSTVSFIWQLLKKAGFKAGFISTVQYSLGEEAIANPEHQTTPEAPIVQRELYEMLQNGCTHAVVESSSHGLSVKTNRLGDIQFDVGVFMNVTLEHLEFHGTFEQYRNDKANLFRALDKYDHKKIINGKETNVPSFGIVNLEDPSWEYFASCTKKTVYGFTTSGKAGRAAAEGINAPELPKIPEKFPHVSAANIAGARYGLTFNYNGLKSANLKITAPLPGSFNAYNLMAALLAVSLSTEKSEEELVPYLKDFAPVTGRMTVIDQGQPFEVIVDYAHTPSSFETIFPPIKSRCTGKIISLFGSGGERDLKKRPLQGQIAAKFSDIVILTDEDPRGEDSISLLEMIAKGAREEGKKDDRDLFLIPDRPSAIRKAFSLAQEDDIILLLGKSHENSIIYKDHVMKYDEIAEAKKALSEMGF